MYRTRSLPDGLKLWNQKKGLFPREAGGAFRLTTCSPPRAGVKTVSPVVTVCGTQDGKRPWSPEPGSQGASARRQRGLGKPAAAAKASSGRSRRLGCGSRRSTKMAAGAASSVCVAPARENRTLAVKPTERETWCPSARVLRRDCQLERSKGECTDGARRGIKKTRWRPLSAAKQRESAKMVPAVEQASSCLHLRLLP